MELKDKGKRGFFSFLLSDGIKTSLSEGSIDDLIYQILNFIKEAADADIVNITIWDTENNILYLHRYISAENTKIPPAKPGYSPLGVCMLQKKPVHGPFDSFPKGSPKLRNMVGDTICIPLNIPERSLVGAIGIGRKKGRPPFTSWAEANLQVASNVLSIVLSVKILQDLLNKERRAMLGLYRIVSSIMEERNPKKRIEAMLETVAGMFNCDIVILAKVDEKNRLVIPIAAIGIESAPPIPFGRGVMGRVAETGKPKLLKSYPLHITPAGYERYAEKTGSFIASPVRVDETLRFIIGIARHKGKKVFTSDDFYFFHIFQRVLGLMLTLQQAEEERERLSKIKTRIERLDSLATLAGGIAHDFNNIINVIMGYSQLGIEHAKDKSTREFFEAIYNQCQHAANLTSQILLISRDEESVRETLNMKPLVKGITKLLRRTLPENIEVKYEDDGEEEYYITGDPSQIHSMLINLASNAKDAMPDGGTLTIRLKKGNMPLSRHEENAIIVEVEDTGCGIEEPLLDRIFDPFFTTKEPGKGTGLGLAQVHNAVSSMGGVIDVKSSPSKGTCFTIYLPEKKPSQREEKPELLNEILPKLSGSALVVEDNQELLGIVVKMLKKMGLDTTATSNPEEAERLLEEKDYQFLITDIVMPRTSGLDLVRKLKSQNKRTKVVLITGYTDRIGTLTELAQDPCVQVLLKPFSVYDLAEALKELNLRC